MPPKAQCLQPAPTGRPSSAPPPPLLLRLAASRIPFRRRCGRHSRPPLDGGGALPRPSPSGAAFFLVGGPARTGLICSDLIVGVGLLQAVARALAVPERAQRQGTRCGSSPVGFKFVHTSAAVSLHGWVAKLPGRPIHARPQKRSSPSAAPYLCTPWNAYPVPATPRSLTHPHHSGRVHFSSPLEG